MEKITTREKEQVWLKKSFDGWRVIYPYRNEDNSLNWKHILIGGNKWHLIKVILIVLMILGLTWSYRHDTQFCQAIPDNFILIPKVSEEKVPFNPYSQNPFINISNENLDR